MRIASAEPAWFGRIFRGAVGLVLALGLANAGCAMNTGVRANGPNNPHDPTAKIVTISPGAVFGHVIFDHRTTRISKKANERVQWENDTDEILFLAFDKMPVGYIIQPHDNSMAGQACKFCDAGGTGYPYKVFHMVAGDWVQLTVDGPPGDPQVVVGD